MAPSQRSPPRSSRHSRPGGPGGPDGSGEQRHHRHRRRSQVHSGSALLSQNDDDGYENAEEERRRERQRRSRQRRRRESEYDQRSGEAQTSRTVSGSGQTLSFDMLAKLDRINDEQESTFDRRDAARERRGHRTGNDRAQGRTRDRRAEREAGYEHRNNRSRHARDERHRVSKTIDTNRRAEEPRRERRDGGLVYHRDEKRGQRRRVVSGNTLEKGEPDRWNTSRGRFHGIAKWFGSGSNSSSGHSDDDGRARRRKRRIVIGVIIAIILLAIVIGVAVGVSKNKSSDSPTSSGASGSSGPSNGNLNNFSHNSIPESARGTYLDPFTWLDTTDFNVTYTNDTVGGLSIMGLNSTWDNSARAGPSVPLLSEKWQYGTTPVRGMNVGGWLSIEPFITPSLFRQFSTADGVIDEYTLTAKLGPSKAASTLEMHYSTFITEQDFSDIAAAGFDHIRIPYSYWAVTTYDGDPYVPKISWRYLLRGIEYCRKYGLRVNLDLHGAPGSQNGWNHSGRQGVINWLNGTDGELNGQRTIDIHKQLGTFFSQDRYNGLVTMYGLVNEPKMIDINSQSVLDWSQQAIDALRGSGLDSDVVLVVGDGFYGLANWQGNSLSDSKNGAVLLDVHQYVIFNVAQIVLDHKDKIDFACGGWTQQTQQSMNRATGFGSFLCGEWSQADTDCQQYINNVGIGHRWDGTMDTGNATTSVLDQTCPTRDQGTCSCQQATADASRYSPEYRQWLRMFAEAQMTSYEYGWGWFYWTWKTEGATQWSWQLGMAAGTLPNNVGSRDFSCDSDIPDFAGLSETY